jgi:hypothetical protein
MTGGALGLAVLASIASTRSDLPKSGTRPLNGQVEGLQLAFLFAAAIALAAPGQPTRKAQAMLQTVDTGERSLEAYRAVAPEAILDRLIELAVELRGLRLLQLNATPYGDRSTLPARSAIEGDTTQRRRGGCRWLRRLAARRAASRARCMSV